MDRTSRAVWAVTFLWGAAIPWLAHRPPLIDLPQHAGQVALVRDLVAGHSPWAAQLSLNFLTPYLTAYGLAALLSSFASMLVSIKAVLSLGYMLFVALGIVLRRQFGGDPRLDWLLLPGFFGFAYQWGFLTFLFAASIGLAHLAIANWHAGDPRPRSALALFVAGLLLVVSHGLAFAFAWIASVILVGAKAIRQTVPRVALLFAPLAGSAVVALALFISSRHLEAQLGVPENLVRSYFGTGFIKRLAQVLVYSFDNEPRVIWGVVALAFVSVPWLMGLRPRWSPSNSWVPFGLVVGTFLAVPSVALSTAFLYQRFAVFTFPAYAWLFVSDSGRGAARWKAGLGSVLAMTACWTVLGLHSVDAIRFSRESKDFETILGATEGGARALYLPVDPSSASVNRIRPYLHYAAWYEAEKHGLVDVNFAWFSPQIVRFREGHFPPIRPGGFEWGPLPVDWALAGLPAYRYVFVRSEPGLDAGAIFSGARCQPSLVKASGAWAVYEFARCPG